MTSLSAADLREIKWKLQQDRKKEGRRAPGEDVFRRPIPGVDPLRLDSAGWCVIFAPEAAGLRDDLLPLLEHRKAQAGASLYKEVVYDPNKPEEIEISTLARVQRRRLMFAGLSVLFGLGVWAAAFRSKPGTDPVFSDELRYQSRPQAASFSISARSSAPRTGRGLVEIGPVPVY